MRISTTKYYCKRGCFLGIDDLPVIINDPGFLDKPDSIRGMGTFVSLSSERRTGA